MHIVLIIVKHYPNWRFDISKLEIIAYLCDKDNKNSTIFMAIPDNNIQFSQNFDNAANKQLSNFLAPMDGPHKRSAILRISDATGLSRATIMGWVNSRRPVRDIYKKIINEEFRQQIFTL